MQLLSGEQPPKQASSTNGPVPAWSFATLLRSTEAAHVFAVRRVRTVDHRSAHPFLRAVDQPPVRRVEPRHKGGLELEAAPAGGPVPRAFAVADDGHGAGCVVLQHGAGVVGENAVDGADRGGVPQVGGPQLARGFLSPVERCCRSCRRCTARPARRACRAAARACPGPPARPTAPPADTS